MNRGDRFEAVPLPDEAQMSPALAVCTADFDGDDLQDIFLGQNFLSTHPESPAPRRGELASSSWGRATGSSNHFLWYESGVRVYGRATRVAPWRTLTTMAASILP
jgi:hypothetical protein